MKNQKYVSRLVIFLLTLVLAGALFTGCGQNAAEDTTVPEVTTAEVETPDESEPATEAPAQIAIPAAGSESDTDQKNSSYLAYYFDIDLSGQTLDAAIFSESLQKVAGEEAALVEGDLNTLTALKAAVISADFEELALSYPADKAKECLLAYGIDQEVDAEYAAYLAAALDGCLIDGTEGKLYAKGSALETQDGINLLMAVATVNGDARNYLGYSNDPQVYARIDTMWNSFLIFDDPLLTELGKSSVEQGITTGYNLKTSTYDSRFLPSLTIQYGHDNIKHAHQLLALLNSEDIVVKVQLEPKVSVYQYLLEWGPEPEPSLTYEVKQFSDDLYLVFAVEYDLMMEFDSPEDMQAFDSVIEQYAKKYEGNEEALGLIYSSWWQPLYSTTQEGMPTDNYHMIYDCVVSNGTYSIHPFSLPENLENVREQFAAIAPDLEMTPVTRYCNTAFYSYMKGDDFQ